MIFGTANGTLPTALSLIRVVDPDFETPVASDYVYSTGIMFFLAIPIILCVNLPANGHFWLFVGLTGLYTLGALIAYIALAKKKAFKKTGTFFYMGE